MKTLNFFKQFFNQSVNQKNLLSQLVPTSHRMMALDHVMQYSTNTQPQQKGEKK